MNSNINKLTKYLNLSEIKEFYNYLGHSNTWLHVFKPQINGVHQKNSEYSNFYNDFEKLKESIEKYKKKGLICFGINERPKGKTKKEDITRIQNIVVDLDVRRSLKKDFVSLPEHHQHAINKAKEIIKFLIEFKIQPALLIDSGNGAHIYFKVDLDNNIENIQKLTTFENIIKKQFTDEILEVDCITKDVNRRMKVPGVINYKDTHQKEFRFCRIVEKYPQNYDMDHMNNIVIENLECSTTTVNIKKITSETSNQNNRLWRMNLEKIFKKDKELLNLYEGKTIEQDFGGDRSSAEQSLVNSFYFKGFRSFEAICFCMNDCKIGKWQEKENSYKELTFSKAQSKYQDTKNKRISKFLTKFEGKSIYPSLNIEVYYLQKEKAERRYLVYYLNNYTYAFNSLSSCVETLFHLLKDTNFKDLDVESIGKIDVENIEKQIKEDIKSKAIFVNDIGYLPAGDRIFSDDYGNKFVNTYVPSLYNEAEKIQEGNFPYITKLIMHLCDNDIVKYDYMNKRIAYVLQKPQDKISTAIVIQSPQGAGKNVFFDNIISPIFGARNCSTINQALVDGKFNSYMYGQLWIAADELKYNEKLHDTTTEKLKAEVTNKEVQLEIKNKTAKIIKNYSNWFFFSNNSNPIKISDDNRRFSVFRCDKIDKDFIIEFLENVKSELYYYIYYLLNLEVDRKEVDSVLITSELKDIQLLHKTPLQQFLEDLKTFGSFYNLFASLPDLYKKDISEKSLNDEWIQSGALPRLFLSWCDYYKIRYAPGRNTFINELRTKYRVEQRHEEIEGTKKRVYIYSDFKFETQKELGKYNEKIIECEVKEK